MDSNILNIFSGKLDKIGPADEFGEIMKPSPPQAGGVLTQATQ